MKLLRGLLAVLWLAISAAATAHAMPIAEPCHMAGKSHAPAPADSGAMPCCHQPLTEAAAPADTIVATTMSEPVRLFPLPAAMPSGHGGATEPPPPKHVLNA